MTPVETPPRRVAVLRFSSVGDIVLTTPALTALRTAWPDTEIVYATKQAFGCLVEPHPAVSRVVPLTPGESAWSYARRLREAGVDAVLDLHGKMRSRVIRGLLRRARKQVWTSRPWGDNLPVRLGLRPYRAQMPIAQRYHQAAEGLVGRRLPPGPLQLRVPPSVQVAADALLAQHDLHSDRRALVAIAPGAVWATKRWPVDRFAEVARHAAEAGCCVAVTGSPAEHALAEHVTQAVPGAVNLCGHTTLATLVGVLARCRVVVANDSGPMHIGRALGVATLAFFGSTDPRQFDFNPHAALFAGVPCAPCHFYGRPRCPRKHFRCMRDITPAQARQAFDRLLAAPPPNPVSA